MAASLRPCFGPHPTFNKLGLTLHSTFFPVTPPRRRFAGLSLSRASDDPGAVEADSGTDTNVLESSSGSGGNAYVGLFVRMLGLDNDPLDREQAIITLWKYSLGGRQCIDMIMQFPGCITLTVNLLNNGSPSACEAAAGLLRTLASVSVYRDVVAEKGAIEEIGALLSKSNLNAEVKEQSLCALWNLSVNKILALKMVNSDLLVIIVKFLNDQEMKVKEAAGGALANIVLIPEAHGIMVEAGLIPKLAELLKSHDGDVSKVIRTEAKSILLELAANEYFKILIIEEGLVLVPLVGAAAYKSFRPVSHAWPSLPDGTELKPRSEPGSRYGASELLLGLNMDDKGTNLDEAKMNAVVGRTRQQFLVRIGAIEKEVEKSNDLDPTKQLCTLLPWIDGVARLVLILSVDDEQAIERAANSIADAAINEHMRTSFKEAGAVKYLVQLLGHENQSIILAATWALGRLSLSSEVCRTIEAEGAVSPLVDIIKRASISNLVMEKAINALARLLDPGKSFVSMDYIGSINGSNAVNGSGALFVDVEKVIMAGKDLSNVKFNIREHVFDISALSRLGEILKSSSSANLQANTASILDYLAYFDENIGIFISADIESAIDAVFQQSCSYGLSEMDNLSETGMVAFEEAGIKLSAVSRLFAKLLNMEHFYKSVNHMHFVEVLRKLIRSNIPLQAKEWIGACLVKLEAVSIFPIDLQNPVNMEVILYETIPRLVEHLKTSFHLEAREKAVIELNEILSVGIVEFTRAVAAQGAVFPLVKLIEEADGQALEAGLAILYNLSMDSENHTAIIAAGAIPVLRRIVVAQKLQWTRALHLLRTLLT